MTDPLSARMSMGCIARRSFHRAAHSHRSSSISTRRTKSFIGRIAKGCASCVRISTVRALKSWWTRAKATPTDTPLPNGAWGSPWIPIVDIFTGRRRGLTPPGKGASSAQIPKYQKGRTQPIDLELDVRNLTMYWTDRGDPPRGNTVNRASVGDSVKKQDPEIVFTHLMEGIGIALDLNGERMFLTDLGGSVYSAKLDGTDKKTLRYAQGNLAGIAYAELPSRNA